MGILDVSAALLHKAAGLGILVAPFTQASFGAESGYLGWVEDHNYIRALHGASAVSWDPDLAQKAQNWANNLNTGLSVYLLKSDHYKIWPPSGENIEWGYSKCQAAGQSFGAGVMLDANSVYNQHCAVVSWYSEYLKWQGIGDWRDVDHISNFTAMVWKGIDVIGCAQGGNYYVCEYGSVNCKTKGVTYGGQNCFAAKPSHLANFNKPGCKGTLCVAPSNEAGAEQTTFSWILLALLGLALLACFSYLSGCFRRSTLKGRGLAQDSDSDDYDDLSTRRDQYASSPSLLQPPQQLVPLVAAPIPLLYEPVIEMLPVAPLQPVSIVR